MNTPLRLILLTELFLVSFFISTAAIPKAGFSMPDSLREVTLMYKELGNLVLLPITINDTIKVNLILDTGCHNLVLFGKRFDNLFVLHPNKKVQFSGLGSGKPVDGKLSLTNKVSIGAVIGERMPIVIIPDQNLFGSYVKVDGVIGYDIFIKFEVELNFADRLITFRPAFDAEIAPDYEKIEIQIKDSRPIINSTVFFQNTTLLCELMIDTGSSLGLLLKTSDIAKYPTQGKSEVIGRGLNGNIEGTQTFAKRLLLDELEIKKVPMGIIFTPWHSYASVGMDIIRKYSIVLNYCKSYAGFKKS